LKTASPPNLRSPRALVFLLRFGAVVLLLALLAVVMPLRMMMATNAQLGLDPLPAKPIVAYLTRSLSALYAYHGLFLLYISFDVRRYMPLIRFIAWSTVGFGLFMLILDPLVGMPWYWTAAEGPAIITYGVALLAVSKPQA
jgi:hypothetical protein